MFFSCLVQLQRQQGNTDLNFYRFDGKFVLRLTYPPISLSNLMGS